MSKRPGKNKENLEETRRIFLDIAQEEFTNYGFAQASTSRIVEQSGMARGSLYYHFGDKTGLFKAVYERMLEDALQHVSVQMDKEENSWNAFTTGCRSFLDMCMDPAFRKITLIESQAAIPFSERLEIQKATLFGKLLKLLPDLFKDGHFSGFTIETISVFIFGILGEIGRALDFAADIKDAREKHETAFLRSIENLKQA